MNAIKFKYLNKSAVLKRIGRELLARFFERFHDAFALPPPISDDDYFKSLAGLLAHPEHLPDALNEALVAIDDLGSPQGHQALEAAPEWPAMLPLLAPDSTREDIAMQLWLAAPDFLARVHNSLRLRRLTAFEHAAHSPGHPSLHHSITPSHPFPPPDRMAILALTMALDGWFARNQRGSETTRVEVYPMDAEYWFLIRHGDIFTRAPKVERQATHILHFRPERDDVVVYSPALDELRVNARTKGERDLYIEQFGLHLRGAADYFSNRFTYTLEPLRTHGADALDAREIDGVKKIVLRELEVAFDNGNREVITRATQGLFEFAAATPNTPDPIPKHGRLARAIFEIQFAGSTKSHPVEIRLPNVLKVSRRCDVHVIEPWLSRFRRDASHELLATGL